MTQRNKIIIAVGIVLVLFVGVKYYNVYKWRKVLQQVSGDNASFKNYSRELSYLDTMIDKEVTLEGIAWNGKDFKTVNVNPNPNDSEYDIYISLDESGLFDDSVVEKKITVSGVLRVGPGSVSGYQKILYVENPTWKLK